MTVVRVFWLWPGVVLLGGCALVAGDRGSVVSVEDRPLTTASRSEPRAQVPRPTEVASLPTPPVASPLPAPEPVAVVATLVLWARYGTAVFYETIAAGIAACL